MVRPNVPVDFLPLARGFTAGEVEAATSLVCRTARDRSDCLDLLDALGLLRSALEGLHEEGRFAGGQNEEQGSADGEGEASG
ncbi:hypothetical protein [Streptomyces sp. NPDC017993]|uniref:hypothetical protein n=1 Tax=Streptomyces sp. NPDC017993 TaxID=3365027 RepID=UPI0037B6387E